MWGVLSCGLLSVFRFVQYKMYMNHLGAIFSWCFVQYYMYMNHLGQFSVDVTYSITCIRIIWGNFQLMFRTNVGQKPTGQKPTHWFLRRRTKAHTYILLGGQKPTHRFYKEDKSPQNNFSYCKPVFLKKIQITRPSKLLQYDK